MPTIAKFLVHELEKLAAPEKSKSKEGNSDLQVTAFIEPEPQKHWVVHWINVLSRTFTETAHGISS